MKRILLSCLAVILASCSSGGSTVATGDDVDSRKGQADVGLDAPVSEEVFDLAVPDLPAAPDEWVLDSGPDAPFVACEPGEGCFLDPCTENAQCQSGWCVEHMGDGVCTQVCQEECPPGWTCKAVGTGGPDMSWVCVSQVSNLCKPCATGADCKSPGGADDVCVDYGTEGSFCGGKCTANADCPWGFLCGEAVTVDGTGTKQCVAETGSCPCTGKSIELALSTPCEVENELGLCTGKRVCTADGLSDCDALVPSAEVCNGTDDNCDGDVDEETCDDGNACTDDSCLGAEGCVNEPLDGGECMDGNPCTVADHCEAGACVGQLVDCDDGNPCTEDWCNPAGGCAHGNSKEKCDDGDVCTVGDQCDGGECKGYPINCECDVDADCAALEDGDLCNGTLVCSKEALPYECVVAPGSVVVCPEPTGMDAICLQAACDPETGKCAFAPDHEGFACDDGDLCTVGDQCVAGECVGGAPLNCNDGNPCTTDSCNPAEGCAHGNSNEECDDGNACTEGDQCSGGQCVGTALVDCDDGNPCTKDSCAPATGCAHAIVAGPCDDGSACTLNDKCINGECVPGPLADCNDGNPCTTDTCDPATGCAHGNSNDACDDKNACTTGDHCEAGVCVYGGLVNCDDGNVCTTDSCDPKQGCLHLLNTAPCDDEDLCTTGDHCHLGECISSGTLSCNDGNLCTDDACLPASGCLFEANDVLCDDGNACTTVDQCFGGQCKGSVSPDCDDGNPCTVDTCNPEEGCVHGNSNDACNDGNACTANDQCAGGECQPGTPVDCDDGNLCTDDSCNPQSGCVHADNDAACNDGNACTSNDHCASGECDGAPVQCNDGNACTNDVCEPDTGCLYIPITPCCGNGAKEAGEECDDGNTVPGDGCDATCHTENVSGCADGTADQVFQAGVMVACNGSFLGTQIASACGPGWHPANPNEYFTYGGKTVKPNQLRWVDTAWNSAGHDVPLSQWQGYYDCSNGAGWNGICTSSNCTWVSSDEQCYLTFVDHDYGYSYGCHCRGGNPTNTTHGVICVNDANSLPRL